LHTSSESISKPGTTQIASAGVREIDLSDITFVQAKKFHEIALCNAFVRNSFVSGLFHVFSCSIRTPCGARLMLC